MPKLRKLKLQGCKLTDRAVEALAASPNSVLLEDLDLSDCPLLTDKSAEAIANSPYFGNLRMIGLDCLQSLITDKGAKALVGSAHLPSLENIGVIGRLENTTDEVLETLVQNRHMSHVNSLMVDLTATTEKGIESVAKAPYFRLQKFESINTEDDDVCSSTDRLLPIVRSSHPLKSLQAGNLDGGDGASDRFLFELRQNPAMSELEDLNLNWSRYYSVQSVVDLVSTPDLPKLKRLGLLTDDFDALLLSRVISVIAGCPHRHSLEKVGYSDGSEEDELRLELSPHLPRYRPQCAR